MKNKIYAVIAAALCITVSVPVAGQSTQWFVDLAAGVNLYQGEDDPHIGLGPKRYTVSPVFNIGGWFTPSIGMQGSLWGGALKGLSIGEEPYSIEPNPDLPHMGTLSDVPDPWEERWNYVMGQVEATCNFSNAIFGCNPDRIWNVIGHAGVEIARSYGNGHRCNSYGGVCGIKSSWKVAGRANLFVDETLTVFGKNFDMVTYRGVLDDMLTLRFGITFNIGRKMGEKSAASSITEAYRAVRAQDSINRENARKQQ